MSREDELKNPELKNELKSEDECCAKSASCQNGEESQEETQIETQEEPSQNKAPLTNISTDELLRTSVDRESVVSFIEGMVQAMGSAAAGAAILPQQTPHRQHQNSDPDLRRYQSKLVSQIMQKLQRLEKYPDLAREVQEDPLILEWLEKNGCKQKDYFEEFECAQALTSFYGGYRRFELAIKAASKALSITSLHRREDEEQLAELNWVLADLHAAADKMEPALNYLKRCLALLEPGSDENHPTYQELLAQLNETNDKSKVVATATT